MWFAKENVEFSQPDDLEQQVKELKKSRILLTGVQGQVGFELVKSLGTCGAELILAARNTKAIEHLGYPVVALDLADKIGVQNVVREIKPHIVINPAAYTAVDKAESDKDQAYLVNEEAMTALCEVLKEIKAGLIHFSTDYVYNATHQNPNVETDVTSPGNVYAASKLAGERVIANSSIPHIILRTSWVYGTSGNNFVKTMIKLARERETLGIVSDQVGSPTSAATLAQAVASILQQGAADPVGFLLAKQGIYNISDRGYTTWHDFAVEIFKLARGLGIELKVNEVKGIKTQDYKTPAARPLNSRLSLEKLGRELNIVPPTWQQSLGAFLHQSNIKLF
ncbi:MAG: dTDP-4-dehydrorhamnose reductase [Proteobacteria bacterium]|nr:MAG: dTDP-4-dehydrorhamnose reductase [Pseudomonadota bacterium]